MRNRHGPNGDIHSDLVRNAKCGCTSSLRFPTLLKFHFTDCSMLTHIRSENDLDAALEALQKAEPRFAALVAHAGRPPLRRRPDGFAGIAATVVSQQLSTASRSEEHTSEL